MCCSDSYFDYLRYSYVAMMVNELGGTSTTTLNCTESGGGPNYYTNSILQFYGMEVNFESWACPHNAAFDNVPLSPPPVRAWRFGGICWRCLAGGCSGRSRPTRA